MPHACLLKTWIFTEPTDLPRKGGATERGHAEESKPLKLGEASELCHFLQEHFAVEPGVGMPKREELGLTKHLLLGFEKKHANIFRLKIPELELATRTG